MLDDLALVADALALVRLRRLLGADLSSVLADLLLIDTGNSEVVGVLPHDGAILSIGDVHLMRDGRLAVIHDASLKRTAGADVLVEDLTAEELKTYRLEGTDEQIPLLEEVLELFQDLTPLIIELKAERGNHAALAEATCRMLDRYRVHYCIESFDPRCLIWLKKNRPEIVRGQLSEQFLRHGETAGHGKATMWLLGNLFSNIAVKPDFIAYRFSDRDNLCLRWCRKFYHVQEINWTIRTKEEMEAAEAQGNLVIFECFDPKG